MRTRGRFSPVMQKLRAYAPWHSFPPPHEPPGGPPPPLLVGETIDLALPLFAGEAVQCNTWESSSSSDESSSTSNSARFVRVILLSFPLRFGLTKTLFLVTWLLVHDSSYQFPFIPFSRVPRSRNTTSYSDNLPALQTTLPPFLHPFKQNKCKRSKWIHPKIQPPLPPPNRHPPPHPHQRHLRPRRNPRHLRPSACRSQPGRERGGRDGGGDGEVR